MEIVGLLCFGMQNTNHVYSVVKSTTFVSLVTVNNPLPKSFCPLRNSSSNLLACAQTTEIIPILTPSNDSIMECRALSFENAKIDF
jgi:hypothetical protein